MYNLLLLRSIDILIILSTFFFFKLPDRNCSVNASIDLASEFYFLRRKDKKQKDSKKVDVRIPECVRTERKLNSITVNGEPTRIESRSI